MHALKTRLRLLPRASRVLLAGLQTSTFPSSSLDSCIVLHAQRQCITLLLLLCLFMSHSLQVTHVTGLERWFTSAYDTYIRVSYIMKDHLRIALKRPTAPQSEANAPHTPGQAAQLYSSEQSPQLCGPDACLACFNPVCLDPAFSGCLI